MIKKRCIYCGSSGTIEDDEQYCPICQNPTLIDYVKYCEVNKNEKKEA